VNLAPDDVHNPSGVKLCHSFVGYDVPRVAPATLGAGAGGGAPPSSPPSHRSTSAHLGLVNFLLKIRYLLNGLLPPRPTQYAPHHHQTLPVALFWPLQVQVDPDMSSPLRKMQAVVPWASSGVAVATNTEVSLVSLLLARWARVDGEGALLEVMLRDCVLERSMAEGDVA